MAEHEDEVGAPPPAERPQTPRDPADLHLEVPEDARDLVRDAQALARERRAAARAGRRGALLALLLRGPGARVGVPAAAVLAVLTLVAVPALLAVLLRPAAEPEVPSVALASPSVTPGALGGLLPDVVLQAPQGALPARQVTRPGALVLVPATCDCDALLPGVLRQVRELTRNLRLVVHGADAAADVERLRAQGLGGLARTAVDPTGALSAAYGRGVTVVAVGPDGRVLAVLPDVQDGERLEGRLAVLRPRAG